MITDEKAKALIVRILSRDAIGDTEHGDKVHISEVTAELLADAIEELILAHLDGRRTAE